MKPSMVITAVLAIACIAFHAGATGTGTMIKPGDTNLDGAVNALDIDAIYSHFYVVGSSQWDLTGDGKVNRADVDELVTDILHTGYGDANLDRRVDSLDFQALLNNWQLSATWATGDWTGDGTCDALDFQMLLTNWNPVGFPDPPVPGIEDAPVPEPVTMTLVGMGIAGLGFYIRRRMKVAQ